MIPSAIARLVYVTPQLEFQILIPVSSVRMIQLSP